MPSTAEIVANILVTASIILAARNSVHVWWTTIAGCAVFAWVFGTLTCLIALQMCT